MDRDPFVPLEIEVVEAMLDLAELQPGENHVELGAGDGRFCAAAERRGARSIGYEIDASLAAGCQEQGLNVICGDLFEADVGQADLVTFWLTKRVPELLSKLRTEMPRGSRVVMLFDSCSLWDGIPDHPWRPVTGGNVLSNLFYRYEVDEWRS